MLRSPQEAPARPASKTALLRIRQRVDEEEGWAGLRGPPYSFDTDSRLQTTDYCAPVGRAGILISFARSMSGWIAMSMKPTIISSQV